MLDRIRYTLYRKDLSDFYSLFTSENTSSFKSFIVRSLSKYYGNYLLALNDENENLLIKEKNVRLLHTKRLNFLF